MTACTIVARNYLAHARVLASSYARHHAGRLAVLIVDGEILPADGSGEPFDVVYPTELALPGGEFHRLATMYDATELATAVKPWLLRLLLERTGEPVLYLDPDVEVFASLADLGDLARENGIVLTPHALTPVPAQGESPTHRDLLRVGVFNLGFLAVGEPALPFLDWWGERLRRDSVFAPGADLFVDQRLIDLVPAYFDHVVLRDPGCNVAYWNLFEREVERAEGTYVVNGHPLRFFHFSGFDPARPHVLSRFRTRAAEPAPPAVRELCADYAVQLLANGYEAQRRLPYGFGHTAGGIDLDRRLRSLYREALASSDESDGKPPPDAFDPEQEAAFSAWLLGDGVLEGVSAAGRAASLLASGPDPDYPTRPVRLVRRGLVRLLRHYDRHQRGIFVSILSALRELGVRSDATAADLQDRLTSLEARVAELAAEREYSSHPGEDPDREPLSSGTTSERVP